MYNSAAPPSPPPSLGLQTCAPERDALLLMSLAHAVVAVPVHLVAGVAVVQVDVGGAVRAAAGAELRQVAGVGGLATRRASWLQLQGRAAVETIVTISRTQSLCCTHSLRLEHIVFEISPL